MASMHTGVSVTSLLCESYVGRICKLFAVGVNYGDTLGSKPWSH